MLTLRFLSIFVSVSSVALATINCGSASLLSLRAVLAVLCVLALVFAVYFLLGDPPRDLCWAFCPNLG